MSKYPQNHVAKFDPNQRESSIIPEIASGLTEPEMLAILHRPPVPEDQPMFSKPAANQKILAACKDTIWVVRKEKVKGALLLGVFHHLKLHRLMDYTSFNKFAWDYFRMSHTTAYETIDYAKVIVTLHAAGVATFPLKGQAMDLLFLGLTEEEQVTVWKDALVMGAHERDTYFTDTLKGSKLVDKAKLEALLRMKATSNGRAKPKIEKSSQSAEKAQRAHLSEIVRTLTQPDNLELLAAIERASEVRGCSVAEFFLEAAREKLEHDGERKAAPQPSSDTEALEAEVEADTSDTSDFSVPSKCDEAVHAVAEVRSTTARPVGKGTERFEDIYVQKVKLSSSLHGFMGTEKAKAKGLRKRVRSVSRGKATVRKFST